MKIYILYNFQKGPWGGGNQFLKTLKKELQKKGVYEENLEKSKVILFNSYPFGSEYFFNKVFKIKQKYHEKIMTYRLDGPVSLVRRRRRRDKEIDRIIALFNKLFVDGIIFQSDWCREQNKEYFNVFSKYETVIHNAPDNEIFNEVAKQKINPRDKIKLVATSWSSNWRKGFGIYRFLDDNLDFSKYEMTFVGNSPIQFKNIRWIRSVPSKELAGILKQHDIYVTASQSDPCSNSLIEALSCSLPAVALNDGGHPELTKKGGELFNGKEDIIEKIGKVAKNHNDYQSKISEFSIKKVARDYYEFAEKIYDDIQNGKHQLKQVNLSTKINFYKMKCMIFKWKIENKLEAIKREIWRI